MPKVPKVKSRIPVSTKIPKPKSVKFQNPNTAKIKKPSVKTLLKKAIGAMIPEIQKEMKNETVSKAGPGRPGPAPGTSTGLRRHFTTGHLKGISIPETFHKKPIRVPRSPGGGYEVKSVMPDSKMNWPKSYPKDLLKSKHQASLRVDKAIHYLQGYEPMGDDAVRKSFHGQIPDIMKEIEFRPPQDWWEKAIQKAQDFDSDPEKYSLGLWYGKAVAEPIDSQSVEKLLTKEGDTSPISDGSRLSTEDLAGKGKSETTVTN